MGKKTKTKPLFFMKKLKTSFHEKEDVPTIIDISRWTPSSRITEHSAYHEHLFGIFYGPWGVWPLPFRHRLLPSQTPLRGPSPDGVQPLLLPWRKPTSRWCRLVPWRCRPGCHQTSKLNIQLLTKNQIKEGEPLFYPLTSRNVQKRRGEKCLSV